jgi:hypothetical protein
VHLVPSWRTRAWQIKTARTVLLNRGGFRQKRVKFPIMAKYYPALRRNLANPFVVRCRLAEFELAFWIVVIFN